MHKLIAFTGRARSGKDTAADHLVKKYGYEKRSFATQMKSGIRHMFNLTEDQVNGKSKDDSSLELTTDKSVSARHLLQTLGTDWGRNMIDPGIWIHEISNQFEIMKNLDNCPGMVISDLRFVNEAEWVKSEKGIVININRSTKKIGLDFHDSEFGISSNLVDYNIQNDSGSLEAFLERIDRLMEHSSPMPDVTLDNDGEAAETISDLIVGWADEVFPDRTITNAINKLVLEEIPEYLLAQDNPMELADLAILIYDIAHLAGVDLDDAIRKKMKVNKSRSWEVNETTGLMSHIKG